MSQSEDIFFATIFLFHTQSLLSLICLFLPRFGFKSYLNVPKGHRFLICKKSPLASKEVALIVFFESKGFKDLPKRCFSTIFLICEKSHHLQKKGFKWFLHKKSKERPLMGFDLGPPEWQAEIVTITPCHFWREIFILSSYFSLSSNWMAFNS